MGKYFLRDKTSRGPHHPPVLLPTLPVHISKENTAFFFNKIGYKSMSLVVLMNWI